MIRRFLTSRYALLVFALLAIALRLVFQANPEWAHEHYRNGFFQGYRWFWDHLIPAIPAVPTILIFVAGFIWWMIRRLRRHRRLGRSRWWVLPDAASVIVLWFLVFWGYNYDCPSLTDLKVCQSQTMDTPEFKRLFDKAHTEVQQLRTDFPAGLQPKHLPEKTQHRIRVSQEFRMHDYGFATRGRVRVREIKPAGLMHRLGISGIYLPFAGEGHADAGEALVPRLFTVAHEMSHGYGITDEGEANFVAFTTLTQARESSLQYAGWLQLLRYALGKLKYWDYEVYEDAKSELSEALLVELDEIRAQQNRYEAWFPEVSEAMNDFYLKQQGIEDGVESYEGWLSLAFNYLDL